MPTPINKAIIKAIKKHGVIRLRDLQNKGFHSEQVRRLADQGLITRVGRGLYALTDRDFSEHFDLSLVASRVPHGVVCLISALHFHGIGTQLPHAVWIAVDRNAAVPASTYPPVRVFRVSTASFTTGVEEHRVDKVPMRVFTPAKTVADCFRYRNKIGIDVAIEALDECLRDRRCRPDDIWAFAAVCRVTSVIRPYMEALLSRLSGQRSGHLRAWN